MGLASEGLKGLARARALLDMGKAARMERAREMANDALPARLPLDMSLDIRERRARSQGFTTLGYHGTGTDFVEPEGITWISETPKRANAYADFRRMLGGAPYVAPMRARVQRPFDADALPPAVSIDEFVGEMERQSGRDLSSLRATLKSAARKEESGPTFSRHDFWYEPEKLFGPEGRDALMQAWRGSGFDAISMLEDGERTFGVLDPSNIRSVNAAFDPAKRDSSNLLAGVGGAAVGAGLLAPQEADAAPFGTLARQLGRRTREAWHGSPHVYDQVDLSRMGTGEGAQAYGAGYYAADARSLAESYRDNLSRDVGPVASIDGVPLSMSAGSSAKLQEIYDQASQDQKSVIAALLRNDPNGYEDTLRRDASFGVERARAELRAFEELRDAGRLTITRAEPSLYRLEIPDEDLLDWDAPLSEQPEAVQKAYAEAVDRMRQWDARRFAEEEIPMDFGLAANLPENPTGAQIYDEIGRLPENAMRADQEAASRALSSAGIPGIRYLDGASRNAGEGTRNYVIFDDANVNVVERNGEPIAAMPRGREEPMSAAAGFARPGMMAAAGAGGAVAAYDPVEARQTARRRREIDELVDTMLEDFRRSAAAPRPETPRFETLAQLAEWARAQRTSGIPLYEQPLASTADTLDRLAYGEYRQGREGLGTLAADAVFTAAEVFDPATWAALGRQKQQNLINRITSARERANR